MGVAGRRAAKRFATAGQPGGFSVRRLLLVPLVQLCIPRNAAGLGGITDDERLFFSDGSWHRAQRSRINFETACYYTHEPDLPRGCQRSASERPPWQNHATRQLEREVLVSFYESTGGENWRYADGWTVGDPCFDFWYGVTCDEHGFVIYLEMVDNGLTGTLPSDFGKLANLLKLDLSSTADAYMGHENLYVNRLEGIVPSLASCRQLSEIELSGNRLTGLPPDLHENANSLRVLSASRNRISKFPALLKRFGSLHTLELHRNQILEPLPFDLGFLFNMRTIQLQYNEIKGPIPEQIANMEYLEVFDVSHNLELDGELPNSIIVGWKNAKYLSILNTSVSGYIASLCLDVPFCWKAMYDTHKDLTWATAQDVPDIVNITMELATQYR